MFGIIDLIHSNLTIKLLTLSLLAILAEYGPSGHLYSVRMSPRDFNELGYRKYWVIR